MISEYFNCSLDEAINKISKNYDIISKKVTQSGDFIAVYIQTYDEIRSNIDIIINNIMGKNKIVVCKIEGTKGYYGILQNSINMLEKEVIDCIKKNKL